MDVNNNNFLMKSILINDGKVGKIGEEMEWRKGCGKKGRFSAKLINR